MVLHFSELKDRTETKKALVFDLLLRGVELYRGLPNRLLDKQVKMIKWLLMAPSSIGSDQWLRVTVKTASM
jgi:hypothetical protein